MSEQFDDIIVGAGQAGPSLAVRLAKAGRRVALVERKFFGGTCVNTGCTPTKAMVASAEVAHRVRHAAMWGVEASAPVVSLAKVRERTQAIVLQSRNGVESMLRKQEGCTVLEGTAHFTSPHTMQVTGATPMEIAAERFFLNVGARATVPNIEGVHDVPFLTNTSLLALETLPEHLIVVGGGYIGLEFAQTFRRFGSRVTVVEMGDRLASHGDADVSAALAELFQREDINVRTHAQCLALERTDKGVRVRTNCASAEPAVEGSHVLLAVGRTPNTHDLGLALAGVEVDDRGYIRVNDELQTSAAHIWALGDCNGRGAFTHTAYNDFEIVAANLIDGGHRRVSDRFDAHALFTDPPVAEVGMSEQAVRRSGRKALIGRRDMTRVSRAIEKGETFGFMKVLVDAETEKILGATIFGVGGDEAIHAVLDTMYAGASYKTLQRAMHIHPTVAELLPTVLGDLKPLA